MTGVLLYNIGREKLPKIKFILFKLGLRAREVSPAELDRPIGALAGLEGFDAAETDAGEPFAGEMLVMCGLSSPQFSAFLNALRQNRCPVALKAVLTETNAAWPSYRLYRELQAEHEALQKVKPKDAGERSAHRK
ncbi:MAG: DUF3783 domain-containing protein [Oscillospiraceae bacterium]|nr:DUF3783 domain-containing protein [Oscillospiraceae bacterium]